MCRKRAEARRAAAEKKGLTLPTYGPNKHFDVGIGLAEDHERTAEMGRWRGYMLKLAVRGKEKQTADGSGAPGEPLSTTASSSVSSSLVSVSASFWNEGGLGTPSVAWSCARRYSCLLSCTGHSARVDDRRKHVSPDQNKHLHIFFNRATSPSTYVTSNARLNFCCRHFQKLRPRHLPIRPCKDKARRARGLRA